MAVSLGDIIFVEGFAVSLRRKDILFVCWVAVLAVLCFIHSCNKVFAF